MMHANMQACVEVAEGYTMKQVQQSQVFLWALAWQTLKFYLEIMGITIMIIN